MFYGLKKQTKIRKRNEANEATVVGAAMAGRSEEKQKEEEGGREAR